MNEVSDWVLGQARDDVVAVRSSIVDFFLLLMLAGAETSCMKRGVMEMAFGRSCIDKKMEVIPKLAIRPARPHRGVE